MPFYGVKAPTRKLIAKEARKQYPIQSQQEYEDILSQLWKQPHREEKYIAIYIARTYKKYIDRSAFALYEQMIREGAWWDFVDDIAQNLIGTVLKNHPDAIWPIMETWNTDPHLWIRRTSILCQNKFKQYVDEKRLFTLCLQRTHEKDFFIRKAIGWALREYAKTNPQSVRMLLAQHKDALSPLSYKEASKSL